ncbi:MAG: cardiolipin synthase [Halioglobus sp.]|jgi:cardiolipin synthase
MNIILLTEIIAVTLVLFHLLGIVSAVEAIIKVRTAQGAIAWAISLLTFPYLAVPCYWVFGRNRFDGYLEQREQIREKSVELIEQTTNTVEQHIIPRSSKNSFYSTLYELARMPATNGNNVELLINGEKTFNSIAEGLASAEKYILFEFYIIRDDELGQRLGNIMIERAQAGVKVKVLYDEIGSRTFAKTALHRHMEAAGIEIEPFNTTQGRRNRFQLNFRNHRKIVVVDGLEAWIGGHNVGREYLGLDKKIGQWRDTHTRIEGPAVLSIEIVFATDWRWATREPLRIDWDSARTHQGQCNALVFPSDPVSQFEETGLMYHQLIVDARERIWIASPYFVPDRSIIAALQLAALRGVDVRVIIPDEPDKRIVAMANWSYTNELLPAGVKVYRYQGGFMHQKVLLMDDRISGVGTANFDNRSFRLNFEITLLVDNPDFANQISDMLEADMQHSRKVYKEDMKTSLPWLLGMGIARLMSPIL